MQENKSTSVLTVEQGRRVSMTCVESVDHVTDTQINLTVNGKRVQITGTGLKILVFSQGNGNFTASGDVSGVKYGGKGLSRLLK